MEATMEELLSVVTEDMAWRPKIARIEGGLLYTTDNATLLATNGVPCGSEGVAGKSIFRTPGGRYFVVTWVNPLAPWLSTYASVDMAFNHYYQCDTRLVPVEEAFPGIEYTEA